MALAEGLIEEIAAGLCRFSYLRVIARALPRGWSAMRNKPGTLNSCSCGPETGLEEINGSMVISSKPTSGQQ